MGIDDALVMESKEEIFEVRVRVRVRGWGWGWGKEELAWGLHGAVWGQAGCRGRGQWVGAAGTAVGVQVGFQAVSYCLKWGVGEAGPPPHPGVGLWPGRICT